jgi:flagellar hook-length control protein FliK
VKSASAVLNAGAPPAAVDKIKAGSDSADKPAFDKLLRKPDPASDTAAAKSAHAKASPEKKQDEATSESEDEGASSRPRKSTPTEDWKLAGLGVWGIQVPPEQSDIPPAVGLGATATAGITTTAAAAGAMPTGGAMPASPLPSTAPATDGSLPVPAPLPTASNDSDAAVQTNAAADPAQPSAAKPVLQNVLSFAQHLAAGAAAAVPPEALGLVKEAIDTLRRDGDAEPAAPTLNTMTSASPVSSNGLARTATVNPLEAPMPDLHSEHFDEAVGTRLSWMADQKIGHAHIKVSPGELGMIEVRLRMDGDRIHADFSSAQPEVRQALEGSLARLREMLGEHGFQLAHADVGHRQDAQTSARHGGDANGGESGPGSAGDEPHLPHPINTSARGLLDAYA